MAWLAQTQAEDNSIYGVISLFLMMVAAGLVVIYTFRRRNRAVFQRARQLPLEGDNSGHDIESAEVKS